MGGVAWAALIASATCLAATGAPADLIARGKYLAAAGDCAACHTATGGTPYAGGLSMNTPFGPISTPNITPDPTTGIGAWTDDQFYRAMHEGIGKQGEYLYPVMPFPWYTKVSRDDVMAIKAYLFSLPPVKQPRAASHLSFPFNIRESLLAWRKAFFAAGEYKSDPGQSAQVNRGGYLVEGLAHCGECHDSRLLAGDSKFQKPLQGGVIDSWYAPNITSDVHDGIGGWSNQQLVQFMKTGSTPGKGIAVGPMAETVHSLAQLTNDDLQAIAAYLKSTPAIGNGTRKGEPTEGPGAPGAQAYLTNCASCHGVEGQGLDKVVPPLAGNGAVLAKGPQNVIQVILGGLEARQGYAPMLAIGAGMDDHDVADVANYVRQNWGNAAPATASANMVYDLRGKTDTLMNAAPLQGCPAVTEPTLAKAIADPHRGIASRLGATTEDNMPKQVQAIVAKVKAAAPGVPQAQVVNGLTAAYCRVVREDAHLDANGKALQLGHFSQLVYLELRSNGLTASAH